MEERPLGKNKEHCMGLNIKDFPLTFLKTLLKTQSVILFYEVTTIYEYNIHDI